jgi:hypothetical protein
LFAIAGLAVLAGGGSASAATGRQDSGDGILTTKGLIESLRHREDPRITVGVSGPSEALARLLDGRAYPGACATSLILALRHSSAALPEGAQRLLMAMGPDDSLYERTSTPAGLSPGAFRIHYTLDPGRAGAIDAADEDFDGVPDEIRRLLGLLQEARGVVLEILEASGGVRGAEDGPEPIHDVQITDLPEGVDGWVFVDSKGATVLLDRQTSLETRASSVLRHQIAHLFQLEATADESPWWYEAHASWIADPAGETMALRAAGVTAYLAEARSGLEPDGFAAWDGAALWPHYLIQSGAPANVLGRAWEEMSRVPGNNTIGALDAAVRWARGTSLPEEVRAFRIWNVFLGELDDGSHYSFAAALPTTNLVSLSDEGRILAPPSGLATLGGEAAYLQARRTRGGWRVRFDGDDRTRWDVSLITIPSTPGTGPRLVSLVPAGSSRVEAGVPWHDLDGAVLVVQNLGSGGTDSSFTLEQVYDPVVPVDLMSFTAESVDGAVALSWSTEQESDLAGWRVFRSRDPVGGFAEITTVLIPASENEPGAYMFLDTDVRPGRKYYYLIEAYTRQGFTETSHPAAVRVQPTPSGRRD